MKILTPEIKAFFDSIYRQIVDQAKNKSKSEDDQFADTLVQEINSYASNIGMTTNEIGGLFAAYIEQLK